MVFDISSEFLIVIGISIIILNIVLFFKVWGMTNDIKGIHKLIFMKESLNIESDDKLAKNLKDTVVLQLRRHDS